MQISSFWSVKMPTKIKKSHMCEEGGAHLRISVWHLLMNLKTNSLILYTLVLFYTCVPKSWWYDLQYWRYREWQTENGNFGSFFALLPTLKPQKIIILKKWKKKRKKKCWQYHHFTYMYQKPQSYEVKFLRIQSETDNFLYIIMGHFLSFSP